MDHSATFARHYSRLVSLLMNDISKVDEQKVLLRALVAVSKQGAVALSGEGVKLTANERSVPGALAGVQLVVTQLAAHSIRRIRFGEGARAAEILGSARLLAGAAATGDGGTNARVKLAALKPKAIEIETTEAAAAAAEPPDKGRPAAEAKEKPRRKSLAEEADTLLSDFATADVRAASPEQLLSKLERARSPAATTKVLDDLASLAEYSVRVGKSATAADVLQAVAAREAKIKSEDIRRAHAMTMRRLTKPAQLRAIAKAVATNGEVRHRHLDTLKATKEEGAQAVIDLIAQATTRVDRHVLLELLKQLDDAILAIRRMLIDSRWFVARNAADLLGELKPKGVEAALIELLNHQDGRVRRAATIALLKVNTPDAVRAVHDALGDASPEVRMQAAAGLARKRDARTAATLIRAVDTEQDGDVQIALIQALGKVSTNDAVQKLLRIAQPEGRMFRKKMSGLRVAAVQALGEARTPAAVATLKELVEDKDRDVRETAIRALAHASR